MDLVQAIALLCHMAVGAMGINIEDVDKHQLVCQQYYVKCLKDFKTFNKDQEQAALKSCIEKRQL